MVLNIKIKVSTLLVCYFMCIKPLFAQRNWCDSISICTEMAASISSNSQLNPLWLYSNHWGIYSQYQQAEVLAHAKIEFRIANFDHFILNAGIGGIGTTEWSRSMLHEAYLAGKVFIFDYTIGMQAYSPLAQYDHLTSGNFIMSSNARPYPRVGVGIFDYWSIPYTRDWLQVKGGVYVGRLFNEYDADDEYKCQYTRDVTISEKFAVARIGGWIIKPYLGLEHSVMMGGVMPDGTQIPTDFWASFLGQGSSSDIFRGQFEGEQTNAAGAHQGQWDTGLDINLTDYDIHLSYKRPFSDGVGKRYFSNRSRDLYLSAIITLKKNQLFKHISIECMRTDYQCGNGIPDPCGYDKNGELIVVYPPINREKKWFYEHFDASQVDAWNESYGANLWDDFSSAYNFFSQWCNYNLDFGGRVLYATNSFYRQGWTVNGLCMQSALFHSQKTVEIYGSGYSWQRLCAYPNTRVVAVTLAADGTIANKIDYMAKFTFSNNSGSRNERYAGGSYSWTLAENYYFDRAKFEIYAMLTAKYKTKKNLIWGATIAADFGELYNSVGFRFSIARNI